MSKVPAIEVNLLPKDPFLSTSLGKLLQWSLTVGRYLVIFTELIVVSSFAARFSLDRQVTDLNAAIVQKKSIIESYGDLEENARAVQKKTDAYNQVEQQINIADAFPALSEVIPTDVKLNELTIKTDRVTFAGSTKSNASLNLLINNLQLSGKFKDVSIDTLESGSDKNPGFEFRVQASTK